MRVTASHSSKELFTTRALRVSILVSAILGLSACGEGGGGFSEDDASAAKIVIGGSVGDGPVTSARITVTDASGAVVGNANSDAEANYRVEIPQTAKFPVLITATGGTDMVTGGPPDFTMVSVALDEDTRTANINPFSTLIVKTAQARPEEVSTQSVATVREQVMEKFNFGLDPNVIGDPISVPVDAQKAAVMVKSSEALAEAIRRAYSSLQIAGSTLSMEELIATIAADLSDGALDGLGTGANARVAAAMRLNSAQVLVESMANRLQVNSADATAALDNAIQLTQAGTNAVTADVHVNREMLMQTQQTMAAVLTVLNSQEMNTLAATVGSIQEGATAADVSAIIPASASDQIGMAVLAGVTAPENQLALINGATDSTPAAGDGGSGEPAESHLAGSEAISGGAVNLTAGGTLDWAHWGHETESSFVHKAGVPSQISNFTAFGDTPARTIWGENAYTWEDGDPVASAADSVSAVRVTLPNSGFQLTVPATTTAKTLTLYLGAKRAKGVLEARLQNADVPVYQAVLEDPDSLITKAVTLNFSSASTDTLVITYTMAVSNAAGARISLEAATLEAADSGTGGSTDGSGTDGTSSGTDSTSGGTDSTSGGTDSTSGGTDGTSGGTDGTSGGTDGTSGGTDGTSGGTDGSGSDSSTADSTPVAAHDTATATAGTPVLIDVLANDSGLANAPVRVSVIGAPSHGSVAVQDDQTVLYTPQAGFNGQDSFTYMVSDADGDSATANVSVTVDCANCASGSAVTLSWNPSSGEVIGYKVFYGASPDTASQEVSDLLIASKEVDAAAPAVTYDTTADLSHQSGTIGCFRVKAYNYSGESGYSEAVCDTL